MKTMATLLVRNVDDSVAAALREQAQRHGRSVEEEHRQILRQALQRPRKQSFLEVLAEMPNVGDDEDFARLQHQVPRQIFGE